MLVPKNVCINPNDVWISSNAYVSRHTFVTFDDLDEYEQSEVTKLLLLHE